MSNVKAISGATAEEFDKLTAKAKEEGATTEIHGQGFGGRLRLYGLWPGGRPKICCKALTVL